MGKLPLVPPRALVEQLGRNLTVEDEVAVVELHALYSLVPPRLPLRDPSIPHHAVLVVVTLSTSQLRPSPRVTPARIAAEHAGARTPGDRPPKRGLAEALVEPGPGRTRGVRGQEGDSTVVVIVGLVGRVERVVSVGRVSRVERRA